MPSPPPPSTPAQLQMLVDGLYGYRKPARRDLGLEPRPFTAESVRALEGAIGPLFGLSLRLVDRRSHGEWVSAHRPALAPAVVLAGLAIVVPAALGMVLANVWYRMATGGLLLSAAALAFVHVDWRALFRPTWRDGA